MRTDTIFYELFQTCPGLLFELIGKRSSLAQSYQFSSVEVKELARTMDGVFLPTNATSNQPIYFLEVQFQEDDNFYWRFEKNCLFTSVNTNRNKIGKGWWSGLKEVWTLGYQYTTKNS